MKECKTCHQLKPEADFERSKTKSGYGANCADCHKSYRREWWRQSYRANPEPHKIINRRAYYAHPERMKELRKARARQIKLKVLSMLSKGMPVCKCCGETTIEFLAVDHIHGGGLKERRETGRKGGGAFYLHVLKIENPHVRYQVLCHNCNLSKGFYGQCPHKNNQITPYEIQ